MLKTIKEPSPWYAKGLNFECTGCGKCCTGTPGYVWLSEQEIQEIAVFLGLTIEEFAIRYLRLVDGDLSLKECPKNYDCVFLKDKKCEIYSVRPQQCRTFPWWPRLLKSEKDWEEAARDCEGISPQAPLVAFETIEEQRLIQERSSQ